MKWEDYYNRFWDWSESTRISRISTLTDFTSSAEVAEIASEYCDEKIATRLVKRALEHGVRFLPAEVIDLADCVDGEMLKTALRSRREPVTAEQFDELDALIVDMDFMEIVAKEDRIATEPEPEEFEPILLPPPPVRRRVGLSGLLFGLIGLFGAASGSSGNEHPGRCTGDCASCPAHYGYRYGRWYYGRHHSHGCEFGGNSADGGW